MDCAQKWFDSLAPVLDRLADRWSCEWRHESPSDYGKVIVAASERAGVTSFKLVRMMPRATRTFKLLIKIDDVGYRVSAGRKSLDMREYNIPGEGRSRSPRA